MTERLLTARDIDDAQSTHAERDPIGDLISGRIRTAMRDRIAHGTHPLGRFVAGHFFPHKARDAAHAYARAVSGRFERSAKRAAEHHNTASTR